MTVDGRLESRKRVRLDWETEEKGLHLGEGACLGEARVRTGIYCGQVVSRP